MSAERYEAAARDYVDRQFERSRQGLGIDRELPAIMSALSRAEYQRRKVELEASRDLEKTRRLDAGLPTENVRDVTDLTRLDPEELEALKAMHDKLEKQ